MKTVVYRSLSTLKEYGDVEWLAKRACPSCETEGRLLMGMHPRERITCQECGFKFKIKGRKVA